jgi:hypothetical protein
MVLLVLIGGQHLNQLSAAFEQTLYLTSVDFLGHRASSGTSAGAGSTSSLNLATDPATKETLAT